MKPTLVPVVLSGFFLISCSAMKSTSSSSDLAMSGVGGSGGSGGTGGAGGAGGSGGSGGAGGSGGSGGASQDLSSSGAEDMAMLCSGAADCTSGMPVCCGRIALSGGTVPNCKTSGVTYDCETSAACPTQLNASCTGMQIVRVCKANSDCTEAMYNQCCAFTQGGSTIHFCANSTLAALGGGHCM